MNDQAIEQEIQAKGKIAPRITPDHINEVIDGYNTFNVGAALRALNVPSNPANDLLTICVITLANGFTVTGESACASPENFDQEIGSKIAFDNAKQKIWALEGYVLKQRLFEAGNTPPALGSDLPPHQQRVIDEKAELDDKLSKLNGFFRAVQFSTLPGAEQGCMRNQAVAMRTYSLILAERIAAFPAPIAHQPV